MREWFLAVSGGILVFGFVGLAAVVIVGAVVGSLVQFFVGIGLMVAGGFLLEKADGLWTRLRRLWDLSRDRSAS